MAKLDLGLPSYDSLFSTEEERQESRVGKITTIPISEISDFKDHPFSVKMDDDRVKLIDSVQENGVLVPVLVRPKKDGEGYEMIAGHRRKFALQNTGATEIDAIIRDLDDDQATILMVDSNIQRENIAPTERGYAYKMRLEAMKSQGKRNDLTCAQVGHKLEYRKKSVETLAESIGESRNQIKRYIRLTELIKPLQEMVDGVHKDEFKIAFNVAYELSFLTKEHQEILVQAIYDSLATPSLSQAQQLKRESQAGVFDDYRVLKLLSQTKANQKQKVSMKMEVLDKYFPKSYTPKQRADKIIELLEKWTKEREKNKSRDR